MSDKETTPNNEPSFFQQILALPQALQKRFMMQMGASIVVLFLTILSLVFFKQWGYCVGLLIALYLAYIGLDLVWGYYGGKIQCYRMVCIKATKITKEHMRLVMKELDTDLDDEQATHKYELPVAKKDSALITEHTIMNIYIRLSEPTRIQAWEIIGTDK